MFTKLFKMFNKNKNQIMLKKFQTVMRKAKTFSLGNYTYANTSLEFRKLISLISMGNAIRFPADVIKKLKSLSNGDDYIFYKNLLQEIANVSGTGGSFDSQTDKFFICYLAKQLVAIGFKWQQFCQEICPNNKGNNHHHHLNNTQITFFCQKHMNNFQWNNRNILEFEQIPNQTIQKFYQSDEQCPSFCHN